jgi:hypothetical protein
MLYGATYAHRKIHARDQHDTRKVGNDAETADYLPLTELTDRPASPGQAKVLKLQHLPGEAGALQ